MILTPCQIKAETEFDAFLASDEKEFVLSGFSGVGKTFVTERFLDKLDKRNTFLRDVLNMTPYALYLTATTNKAVRVLHSVVQALDVDIDVRTIYSVLGLKLRKDFKTGKEKVVTTSETKTFHNSIVFIDEASYADDALKEFVLTYFSDSCKIVWIGDKDQLLAVNYEQSPVLDNPDLKHVVHMVTPKRNQGSINKLAHEFRNVLYGAPWPVIKETPEIEIVKGAVFKSLVERLYQSDEYKKDSNYVRILGWTNNKVLSYNSFVRQLYTSTVSYVQGEYLTTNSAVLSGTDILLPSDYTLKIRDVSSVKMDQYNIEYQEITFYGPNIVFKVPIDYNQVNQVLKGFAKASSWYDYFALKETYADMRPSHASTVHKSQGSSFDTVFIDLNDIGLNNRPLEVARLLYVAISRAKSKVYIFGSLPEAYQGVLDV